MCVYHLKFPDKQLIFPGYAQTQTQMETNWTLFQNASFYILFPTPFVATFSLMYCPLRNVILHLGWVQLVLHAKLGVCQAQSLTCPTCFIETSPILIASQVTVFLLAMTYILIIILTYKMLKMKAKSLMKIFPLF